MNSNLDELSQNFWLYLYKINYKHGFNINLLISIYVYQHVK